MTHRIVIANETPEAAEFAAWLQSQGHDASIGNTVNAHEVDGRSTFSDESAAQVMEDLWTAYCNA